MEQRYLEELGLSGTEAKVYLALLKLGSSTAGQIAKKIDSYRRNVYDFLEKLAEKGLVSEVVKQNKKYYEAVHPHKLLEIVQEKERNIKSIMPMLETDFSLAESEDRVFVYKGVEGVKTVLDLVIGEGKPEYIIGARGRIVTKLPYYYPHWNKRRVKKGITINVIYANEMRDKKERHMAGLIKKKYLPEDVIPPVAVLIFGDNVAQLIFGDTIIVVLIKSKTAAEGFMNYFNLLWKIAKK